MEHHLSEPCTTLTNYHIASLKPSLKGKKWKILFFDVCIWRQNTQVANIYSKGASGQSLVAE